MVGHLLLLRGDRLEKTYCSESAPSIRLVVVVLMRAANCSGASVAGEIFPRLSDLGPGTGGSGHVDPPAEVLLRLGGVPRLRCGHACSVAASVAVGPTQLRALVVV